MEFEWLGHASFKIEKDLGGEKNVHKVIYIDPWKLPSDSKKADLILITHPHFDHFSIEDIKKVRDNDTIIVSVKEVTDKIGEGCLTIEAGEEVVIGGVRVLAVPAYNLEKNFHPKKNSWVGFVLTIDDTNYYFAGDTDLIPDMAMLKEEDIDYAFLPVGGTYTMDAEEAAGAVKLISPKNVIPMHYGDIVATKKEAEKFRQLVKDTNVIIL